MIGALIGFLWFLVVVMFLVAAVSDYEMPAWYGYLWLACLAAAFVLTGWRVLG